MKLNIWLNDALWGIIGMISGAGLYAEVFQKIHARFLNWGNMGSVAIPQVLGVNPWIVIILFIICGITLFFWFEKKSL